MFWHLVSTDIDKLSCFSFYNIFLILIINLLSRHFQYAFTSFFSTNNINTIWFVCLYIIIWWSNVLFAFVKLNNKCNNISDIFEILMSKTTMTINWIFLPKCQNLFNVFYFDEWNEPVAPLIIEMKRLMVVGRNNNEAETIGDSFTITTTQWKYSQPIFSFPVIQILPYALSNLIN